MTCPPEGLCPEPEEMPFLGGELLDRPLVRVVLVGEPAFLGLPF